jgi:hypothetical protein
LTPASGRQDHTTSPSAFAPFVIGTISVHRIPPHVRDDRETPLGWGGTTKDIVLIWVKLEQEYFCGSDWTAGIRLIQFNKSGFQNDGPQPGWDHRRRQRMVRSHQVDRHERHEEANNSDLTPVNNSKPRQFGGTAWGNTRWTIRPLLSP